MNVEKIEKQVNQAIGVIEVLEELLISGISVEKEKLLHILVNGVLSVFPDIVDSYAYDVLAEYRNQIEYWENQWNRIQEAIEREDRFYLIDVLSYETKDSFSEYLEMLKTVGNKGAGLTNND